MNCSLKCHIPFDPDRHSADILSSGSHQISDKILLHSGNSDSSVFVWDKGRQKGKSKQSSHKNVEEDKKFDLAWNSWSLNISCLTKFINIYAKCEKKLAAEQSSVGTFLCAVRIDLRILCVPSITDVTPLSSWSQRHVQWSCPPVWRPRVFREEEL